MAGMVAANREKGSAAGRMRSSSGNVSLTNGGTMGSRVAACLAALSLLAAWPVLAQVKFDRPIRMEVGFAPGGTADIIARVVADKMPPIVGQPVVVENRPGAIGRLA